MSDLGDCPKCEANQWEYTEVSIWSGRRCENCGATLLHEDLGVPEGEER